MQTENHKQSLQTELKTTQNNLVDNIESERNRLDDRLIQLQMSIKVKDEKILAQRHEIKILEKKLHTKLSEMSQQRHTIEETEVNGKKLLEGHQYELERRELELKRINRLQQEKDDEIRHMNERFDSKLAKRQKRADEQIEKLNSVVSQQLKEIQSYKGVMADKDRTITELEKQVLLQTSGDGGNKNTFSGKEFDDLGD